MSSPCSAGPDLTTTPFGDVVITYGESSTGEPSSDDARGQGYVS
jgi:hypothetical protein